MALLTNVIRALPSLTKPSYSNLRLVSSIRPSKPSTHVLVVTTRCYKEFTNDLSIPID